MTKKGKKKLAARARQTANGGKYENHLRTVGGIDGKPKASPIAGEDTPLPFTCLTCKKRRDLPLRDFASGTIFCPNHDPPQEFQIPNNMRYRRLAHEVDTVTGTHREAVEAALLGLRLFAINTEPYLALRQLSRIEVFHVDTFETRRLAVGHWNGGALSWDNPVNGNLSVAVLMWLKKIGQSAA